MEKVFSCLSELNELKGERERGRENEKCIHHTMSRSSERYILLPVYCEQFPLTGQPYLSEYLKMILVREMFQVKVTLLSFGRWIVFLSLLLLKGLTSALLACITVPCRFDSLGRQRWLLSCLLKYV